MAVLSTTGLVTKNWSNLWDMKYINNLIFTVIEWISDLMSILMSHVCIFYDWYIMLNWSPLGLLQILTLDDCLHKDLFYIILKLLINLIKITLHKWRSMYASTVREKQVVMGKMQKHLFLSLCNRIYTPLHLWAHM